MCICNGCGKLINESYYYCPWCGNSKIKGEDEASLQLRYEHYLQSKFLNKLDRIEKMEEQLDNLEKELSVLVLSAEMHK